MAIDFTYDIGYMGVVKMGNVEIKDQDGNIIQEESSLDTAITILATGGNISVQQSPMFTTGVWGAGWYNAAQQIAYAPNYITTSGSINFQLTYDSQVQGNAFDQLQDFAFENRNLGKKLYILPNGVAGYQGQGWCQGCSFTASADSIVTGDTNFKTGNVENCISTESAGANSIKGPNLDKSATNPISTSIGSDYLDVFPFWASGVYLTDMRNQTQEDVDTTRPTEEVDKSSLLLRDDIMDWNASYSSQLVLVATCANYTNLSDSKQAKYAALGTMTADGSFTIFRVSTDLDPNKIRACRKCIIEMGTAKHPDQKAQIKYGSIIFSNGSTDVQTGSSFIQSSFSFTALGDGQNPIMKLVDPSGN